MSENSDKGIELVYRNHRGEVRTRRIWPLGVYFGSTQWHPERQWLMNAVDLEDESGSVKQFALKDFLGTPSVSPSNPVDLSSLRYVVYDEERSVLAAFRDEKTARVFWAPIKNSGFKTLPRGEKEEVDRAR